MDGRIVQNPRSLVRAGAAIQLVVPKPARGEAKLRAALEAFRPRTAGRIAVDVGASAGGFTRVLLEAGCRRVYAVDAGHGQLAGSLRQDPRVVNLERTNLGDLSPALVPDAIELVTVDVSYLSLAAAVPQLERIAIAPDADLVALVKPQFELGLADAPDDPDRLAAALGAAVNGVAAAGWHVVGTIDSPVRGAGGAREMLLHARRAG